MSRGGSTALVDDAEPSDAYKRSPSSSSSASTHKKNDSASEHTPLLPVSSPPSNGEVIDIRAPSHRHSPTAIVFVMLVTIIMLSCGDQLMDAPQTRIFESIYCYKYWEKKDPSKILLGRDAVGPGAIGGVDEHWCKGAEIQGLMAAQKGNQVFFDNIPSLLLAIPFGWVADRYGRKPILLLGLLSFPLKEIWIKLVCWFWQSFDPHTAWFGALCGLLGGATPVVSALYFVVLSDVLPEAKRYKHSAIQADYIKIKLTFTRSATFLRIGAANLFAYFVAPPIAAWLMYYNPWIPVFLGLVLEFMTVTLGIWLPETLDYTHSSLPPKPSRSRQPSGEHLAYPGPDAEFESPPVSANFPARWTTKIKDATSFLFKDWRVVALTATFVVHMFTSAALMMQIQYASARYDLSLSCATVYVSLRGGFTFLFLGFLFPAFTKYIAQRFSLDGRHSDLYLSRLSAAMMGLGFVLTAFAPSSPVFIFSLLVVTLGSGFPLLLRSFLTGLVQSHDIAKLYSLISVVDTLGLMVGSPLLAKTLEAGMRLGGLGAGLPYWCVGALYAAVTVLMLLVRVKKGEGDAERYDEARQGEESD